MPKYSDSTVAIWVEPLFHRAGDENLSACATTSAVTLWTQCQAQDRPRFSCDAFPAATADYSYPSRNSHFGLVGPISFKKPPSFGSASCIRAVFAFTRQSLRPVWSPVSSVYSAEAVRSWATAGAGSALRRLGERAMCPFWLATRGGKCRPKHGERQSRCTSL
jgi:hypothetical protein